MHTDYRVWSCPTLTMAQVAPVVTKLATIVAGTVTVIDATTSVLATAAASPNQDNGLHWLRVPIRIAGQLGTLMIGTPYAADLPTLPVLYRLLTQLCQRALAMPSSPQPLHAAPMPTYASPLIFAREDVQSAQQFRYDQPYALLLIHLDDRDHAAIPSLEASMRCVIQHVDHLLRDRAGWIRFAPMANTCVLVLESAPTRCARSKSSQDEGSCPVMAIATQLFVRLRAIVGDHVRIALAHEYREHTTLPQAYAEAMTIIQIGTHFQCAPQVWTPTTLGVFAFLGGDSVIQTKAATPILAPLLAEPALLQTLRAYLACNGQHNAIAQQLHIHRNTLSYRLDKIESLTGIHPGRYADLLLLQSALLVLDRDQCPAPSADVAVPAMLPKIAPWHGSTATHGGETLDWSIEMTSSLAMGQSVGVQ